MQLSAWTIWGLLVSLVYAVNAAPTSWDENVIFKYEALIQNTIKKPTEFTSQFLINCNVHIIKAQDNYIQVQLQDVTYTLYTGRNDADKETKTAQIPPDAESVNLPFLIQFDDNGQIIFFLTDKKDELWSINLKKGIASLLQVDTSQLNYEAKTSYSFSSREMTVYGKSRVFYSVTPGNSSHFTINRNQTPTSCIKYDWDMNFNVQPGRCKKNIENPFDIVSDRNYHVERSESGIIIHGIESYSTTELNMFAGKSDMQKITIKQVMKDRTVIHSDNTVDFINIIEFDKENYSQQSIKVQLNPYNVGAENTPDITRGRGKVNIEEIMKTFMLDLQNVAAYLKTSHVTLTAPNLEHEQSVNLLIYYLRFYSVEHLEKCFSELTQLETVDNSTINVLISLLPNIGTYASNVFIFNIIKNKSVENSFAKKLLQNMPFSTKYPSVQLLQDLSELRDLNDDFDDDLKRIAVLSYATLLSKTIKYNPNNMIQLNEYIDYFINKFNTADKYAEKMLYMNALHNIGTKKIAKFLEPIIKAENNETRQFGYQLRTLAMWAARNEHDKDDKIVNTIYWPIFKDVSQHLEIRVAALNTLLSNPSMSDMMKLAKFMQTERNEELYKYYYKSIESTAESISKCADSRSRFYKELLKHIRLPLNIRYGTKANQFDFYDPSRGFGATAKFSHFFNSLSDESNSFLLELLYEESDMVLYDEAYYFRSTATQDYVDKEIIRKQKLYRDEKRDYDYEISRDIFGEFMIFKQGKIINSVYAQRDKAKHLLDFFSIKNNNGVEDSGFFSNTLLKIKEDQEYNINIVKEDEVHLPTELGIPSIFFIKMPTTYLIHLNGSLNENYTRGEDVGNGTIQLQLMKSSQQIYGLDIYNPMADVWHGSRRIHTVDANLQINVHIDIMGKNIHSTHTLSTQNDPSTGNIGFQYFVQSQVYIFDLSKSSVVQDLCSQCKMINPVTNGPASRHSRVLFEHDDEFTGMNYKLMVFDCERGTIVSPNDFFNINKQNKIIPHSVMLPSVLDLFSYTASSLPGMCGMGIQTEPTHKEPGSYELTLEANADLSFLSAYYKYQRENISQSIRLNSNLSNIYYSEPTFNASLTISKWNESDEIICLDVSQASDGNHISGELNINMGITFDGECVYNETTVHVKMNVEESEEQKAYESGSVLAEYCPKNLMTSFSRCLAEQTSLRHYEFDVSHNLYCLDPDDKCELDKAKIVIDFPIGSQDLNMTLHYDNETRHLNCITSKMVYPIIRPISKIEPSIDVSNYLVKDPYSVCIINSSGIRNVRNEKIPFTMPSKWTSYAVQNKNWNIYAKQWKADKIAIRLEVENIALEIYSSEAESGFNFHMNGVLLEPLYRGYQKISPFEFQVLRKDNKVILSIEDTEVILEFNGKTLNLKLPETRFFGPCLYIQ